MRTRFDPEETEEFEAARDLILRRCTAWAGERDLAADPFILSSALEYRHDGADGRLAWWTPHQVHGFLLEWIPRRVAAEPEELTGAPETLRTLIGYLDATGLLDPRGASAAENSAAIDKAAKDFETAVRDPLRQGLATFWARTAARAGVDLADPDALERFTEDVHAGRVDFDEELLGRLVEGDDLDGERLFAQPPVFLPPEDELARAAAASPVIERLRALAEWAGKQGRALTPNGYLRMSDARELVDLLGTGDEVEGVRSAGELAGLNLVLSWAKRARLVRVAKGRLYAVAKAAPVLADPPALWRRAFEAVPDLRDEICRSIWADGGFSFMYADFPLVVPDVLNTIYGLEPAVPVRRIAESVWLSSTEDYLLEPVDAPLLEAERARVGDDVARLLDVLADLGAVELTEGIADPLYSMDLTAGDGVLPPDAEPPFPPDAAERLRRDLRRPGTLVRLTDLGAAAVRERLVAEGREAGLVGELRDASPEGLLGVVADHYTAETGRAEIAGWLDAHGGDLEPLLEAIRTCPFRRRAGMMLDALVTALPEGTSALRRWRGDPGLAPAVIAYMVDEGMCGQDDLTEAEGLLGMTESILTLLEAAGPDVVREQLAGELQPGGLATFAEAVLNSGHPDREGLREFRELVARMSAVHAIDGRRKRRAAPGAKGRPTGRGKKRKR
ncbi:hypothetical protein [Actinomadura rugatobispora]|uniref:Uncharacterized protein n=1 Tax=Actinomadura rugatobispora TaxID=1994 RepID=A0ABW1A7A2_9ACTN|nr:hypothetical protein GCM10010200_062410 [Actinomadura rugatobispora]